MGTTPVGYDDPGHFDLANAWMAEIADDLEAIRRYVGDQVCRREGFAGLLTPLGDLMEQIAAATDEAAAAWIGGWDCVRAEIAAAGRELERTDDAAAAAFRRLGMP